MTLRCWSGFPNTSSLALSLKVTCHFLLKTKMYSVPGAGRGGGREATGRWGFFFFWNHSKGDLKNNGRLCELSWVSPSVSPPLKLAATGEEAVQTSLGSV